MTGYIKSLLYSAPASVVGIDGPAGIQEKKSLEDYLNGGELAEEKIKSILKRFVGVHPYLELIAEKNQIADPYDEKVVEAYWLGNSLLEKVDWKDLARLVKTKIKDLMPLNKKKEESIVKRIVPGISAHHSFHVFFIGSLVGREEAREKLIDRCRIAWGKVLEIQKENILIEHQSLKRNRGDYELGSLEIIEVKKIAWPKRVEPGNWLAWHWGVACDTLTSQEVKNLRKYTLQNITVYNKGNNQ